MRISEKYAIVVTQGQVPPGVFGAVEYFQGGNGVQEHELRIANSTSR